MWQNVVWSDDTKVELQTSICFARNLQTSVRHLKMKAFQRDDPKHTSKLTKEWFGRWSSTVWNGAAQAQISIPSKTCGMTWKRAVRRRSSQFENSASTAKISFLGDSPSHASNWNCTCTSSSCWKCSRVKCSAVGQIAFASDTHPAFLKSNPPTDWLCFEGVECFPHVANVRVFLRSDDNFVDSLSQPQQS